MPNRILKESICTSDNLDSLSTEAEAFFYRLLVQCDDYGRMDARPPILLSRCYPLRLDRVTIAMVSQWLDQLRRAELITLPCQVAELCIRFCYLTGAANRRIMRNVGGVINPHAVWKPLR